MREIKHICEICNIELSFDKVNMNEKGEVICRLCGNVTTEISRKVNK